MDKYEYKVRADEIKELIAEEDYVQAADIADTIDWRRVKSVMMLCTISDLYKINRRYEDARNMLLLAYERRPGGKTICYSLCELCIKTEELPKAYKYFEEFKQAAPRDPGRYILLYKLKEAQDAKLEERIDVLAELKKRDYREKWAYELAYLYHRAGLATQCVEECDELILWFGEGKYVIKAMELKMLHQPLTVDQQERYDRRFEPVKKAIKRAHTENAETDSRSDQREPVQRAAGGAFAGSSGAEQYVRPEQYAGMEQYAMAETVSQGANEVHPGWAAQGQAVTADTRTDWVLSKPKPAEPAAAVAPVAEPGLEEPDIMVKTMDLSAYNTINLQLEVAAGMQEVMAAYEPQVQKPGGGVIAPLPDSDTESLDSPEIDEVDESDLEPEQEVMEGSEVFFSEAEEADNRQPQEAEADSDHTATTVMDQLRMEDRNRREEQTLAAQPPKELAGVLFQESDGQISLVVPDHEKIEKQITGQMNLEDVLSEWERLKRENEAKRQEEVRQHVLEQTGDMFTEFEESVRDGLLEQLESEPVEPGDAVEQALETYEERQTAEGFEEEPGPETVEEPGAEGFGEEPGLEIMEEPGAEDFAGAAVGEFAEEPEAESQADPEAEEAEGEAPEGLEFEDTGAEPAAEIAEEPETEVSVNREAEGAEEELPEELNAEGSESEITEGMPEEAEPEKRAEAKAEAVEEEDAQGETEGSERRDAAKLRPLTHEEKELYAPFIQSRSGRERLIKAIDGISMAAREGNVIITGEKGMDTLSLAKSMASEIRMLNSHFSGKVAKISGKSLNSKDVEAMLGELEGGALIIHEAAQMEPSRAEALQKALEKENFSIVIFLEDTKKAIEKLLAACPKLQESFTARVDVEAMSNDSLVAFGRQYAKEMEYSIDDLGILALHTRIADRQTPDHVVSAIEVKEIADAAIRHANRKTLPHFFDILLGRRYDEEDMIILTEKDFV